MAKPERPPIFERLEPFAPWDQRGAPSILDEAETKRRAGELAAASDRLAAGLRRLASEGGGTEAVNQSLDHLGNVAEWSAGVWRQAFDTTDDSATRGLAALCDAAAGRPDLLEAIAAFGRVAVPHLLSLAVLTQAELGDDVTPGRARWLNLVIEDLEATRADLELIVQSQIAPGDGTRLASACAEVAKTVC